MAQLEPRRPDALQRAATGSPATQPIDEERGWVVAILSGAARKGHWEPPAKLSLVAHLGGVDVDLRDADLLEGVTEITAVAVMGGIRIIVPADVDVETTGVGLLGGFTHVSHRASVEDAPKLRIRGLAFLGGIDVKVKKLR
jgi:hypothetical protein